MSKLTYLKNSLLHRFSTNRCPSCGSTDATVVDRKLLGLTNLLQCSSCYLRYRFPTDSKELNYKFYQYDYVQPGLTTDLPGKEQLQHLMQTNFANTEKDFSVYANLLAAASIHLKRKLSILDYGANWGYTCFQFKRMNFVENAYGHELSLSRRLYGEENLHVDYINDAFELKGKIDLVFSSHAIEHMSNPSTLKSVADTVLKGDGMILITCPNGSDSARHVNRSWSKLWGEVHPNFISDQYLCHLFSDYSGIVTNDSILKDLEHFDFNFGDGVSSKLPTSRSLYLIAKRSPQTKKNKPRDESSMAGKEARIP